MTIYLFVTVLFNVYVKLWSQFVLFDFDCYIDYSNNIKWNVAVSRLGLGR